MELLSSLRNSLMDIVYPHQSSCLYCGNQELGSEYLQLCKECLIKIDYIRDRYCEKCGKLMPTKTEQLCTDCQEQSYKFTEARAVATYESLADYIHNFKYDGQEQLARPLGKLLGLYGLEFYGSAKLDLIIPVPISEKKLKKRGFNQAYLLAREVGEQLGLKINNGVLKRAVDTVSQSKLSLEQRKENVKDIFYCEPMQIEKIKDQKILLVDDIYTTGATVNECAKVLLRAGAAEVKVLTLATGRQEN